MNVTKIGWGSAPYRARETYGGESGGPVLCPSSQNPLKYALHHATLIRHSEA